jgi:hypothetical protein
MRDHPRQEPGAVIPPAGIRAGGGASNRRPYRDPTPAVAPKTDFSTTLGFRIAEQTQPNPPSLPPTVEIPMQQNATR